MAEKKGQSPSDKQKRKVSPLGILGRFHAVIFVVLVFGGLAVAVFILNAVINSSATPADYAPAPTSTSFDAQTIEKINELRPLSERPVQPQLPAGRTDPFSG